VSARKYAEALPLLRAVVDGGDSMTADGAADQLANCLTRQVRCHSVVVWFGLVV
jgi:hypothetical protein